MNIKIMLSSKSIHPSNHIVTPLTCYTLHLVCRRVSFLDHNSSQLLHIITPFIKSQHVNKLHFSNWPLVDVWAQGFGKRCSQFNIRHKLTPIDLTNTFDNMCVHKSFGFTNFNHPPLKEKANIL
jgi:hypothetical protein